MVFGTRPTAASARPSVARWRVWLRSAHQLRSGGLPLQEASADAEDVVVAKLDHRSVDQVGGDRVQPAVVGKRIELPESRAARVSEPWGELKVEDPVAAEHDVAIAGGVGHDLLRGDAGLVGLQGVE